MYRKRSETRLKCSIQTFPPSEYVLHSAESKRVLKKGRRATSVTVLKRDSFDHFRRLS